MRYLAGFIGGLVVAVLLLVFQEHLIGAEREVQPQPPVVITLDAVTAERPQEIKPYEAREAPSKPERVVRPEVPSDPVENHVVRPELIAATDMGEGTAFGKGPYFSVDEYIGAPDGQPGVKTAIQPQYPASALRNGVEGEVEVEFTVLPDGSVTNVRVIRAEPRGIFEQNAMRAIQRWQFIPSRVNDVATATRARQVIRFELPD